MARTDDRNRCVVRELLAEAANCTHPCSRKGLPSGGPRWPLTLRCGCVRNSRLRKRRFIFFSITKMRKPLSQVRKVNLLSHWSCSMQKSASGHPATSVARQNWRSRKQSAARDARSNAASGLGRIGCQCKWLKQRDTLFPNYPITTWRTKQQHRQSARLARQKSSRPSTVATSMAANVVAASMSGTAHNRAFSKLFVSWTVVSGWGRWVRRIQAAIPNKW